MSIISEILSASLRLLLESAPYMIIGLAAGGLIKAFFSAGFVARHLGRGRFLPVLKAAIIGVPLPLCSCSVVPTASALKKQGAGKGAVTSFLISTPESSMDSIALTYVLIDPLMTVIRPAAAFVTAIAAGIAQTFLPGSQHSPAETEEPERKENLNKRLGGGQYYAFFDLWPELVPWFAGGIIVSGAISALVPSSFFENSFGGGITGMLVIMAVSLGMYICSSASTPVAAVMIMKGMSPGTALVFMLAGPATNIASLGMVKSILGAKGTTLYLACIAVFTLAAGLTTDMLYAGLGIGLAAKAGAAKEILPQWVQWASAAFLVFAYVKYLLNRKKSKTNECSCGSGSCCGGN
jgi:uncharacterized membrane protein YraQ (UPF0718 family)